MKTEELITALAANPAPVDPHVLERRALHGGLMGLVVTLLAFLLLLGPRPGLLSVVANPVVLAKTVLPLILAGLAFGVALRAARPGVQAGARGWLMWGPPLAAAALFIFAFATTAPADRMANFIGHSIPVCLPAITGLSLPMLVGLLAAMTRGAPEYPGRAGALAGLAAAGMATTIYSTFCTEDSPLFYAVWYSLGIAIATGIGAVAGRQFLRW